MLSALDIGGFEAMINIPELSWTELLWSCRGAPSITPPTWFRRQEVNTEILDVDPVRERLSLSLKALHQDTMPLLTCRSAR